MTSRRVLFVHAHPDDETINNGATMARYVAEGAQVTLLTCTLGEEGEVLVPELELLAPEHADQPQRQPEDLDQRQPRRQHGDQQRRPEPPDHASRPAKRSSSQPSAVPRSPRTSR